MYDDRIHIMYIHLYVYDRFYKKEFLKKKQINFHCKLLKERKKKIFFFQIISAF